MEERKFTDRFLKLPVEMFHTKDAEMVGYNDSTKAYDSFVKVNPLEICYYYEISYDEKPSEVKVYLKNGESFMTVMTIDKFEKLVNDFMK